jgi:Polysaccharide lyase
MRSRRVRVVTLLVVAVAILALCAPALSNLRSGSTMRSERAYFDVTTMSGGSLRPWEHVWPDSSCIRRATSSTTPAGMVGISVGPSFARTRQDGQSEKCELWLESHQDGAHALRGAVFGQEGSETWDTYLLCIPNAFVASPGEWNWFLQWHNDSGYYRFSVPGGWEEVNVAIGLRHRAGRIDRWFLRTYGGADTAPGHGTTRYEMRGPALSRNRWITFVQHVVWSPDPTVGLVEWWVDGRRVGSRHTPTLYRRQDGSASYVNYQLGYYRFSPPSLGLRDATVYLKGVRIGPTAGSIGASTLQGASAGALAGTSKTGPRRTVSAVRCSP